MYFYRWWLAERFIAMVDMVTITDTPLLPATMRCMGSTIGAHCHIGITAPSSALDSIFIGDDVTLGKDTLLSTSWVERGRLVLAPIFIGSDVQIGTNSVIEGGSSIGDGSNLDALSMVSQAVNIPPAERWSGSPVRCHSDAQDIGDAKTSRPSQTRVIAMMIVMSFTSLFVLSVVYSAPQIPTLLFDYANFPGMRRWTQTAIFCAPAAVAYMCLVFIELVIPKWVVLGKVKERSYRTTSIYFYRKWFMGRLMDISLVVLRPLYATLYIVPFLRSWGVNIAHGPEVSTARGVNFELTEIGEESFVADGVFHGNEEVHRHFVTLKKTKLNKRTFCGNASLVPQGTELASNTLIGVLSLAPEKALKEGESCFGSPPVLMSSRQRGIINHADRLLYAAVPKQIALRLLVEGIRILVPRVLIIFGLGFVLQVIEAWNNHFNMWILLPVAPFFFLFFKYQICLSCALNRQLTYRRQSSHSPPSSQQSSSNGSSSAVTSQPNIPSGPSTSGSRNS